jgi:hypothetical protein
VKQRRPVNSDVVRLNITLQTKPEVIAALKSSAEPAEEYFRQREPCESPESIGSSGSVFRVFRNVDKPSWFSFGSENGKGSLNDCP